MTISLDDPDGHFSDEEVALAETVAAEIAGAIENARLTQQAQIAAVDAERQRLARELHDSVTQSLYSVILLSSGWQSMAEQGTLADPAASFRQLGEVGLDALREMRLLIHQLRPPILEEIGLVRALQQRLDFVELRADIEPELTTRGDVDSLPPNLEEQLFHIAQEALNNILRHAQASKVSVCLEHNEDHVTLTIHDNGQGFDSTEESGGMGLKTMHERAANIQGTLEITTMPDCDGTTVKIAVPLEAGRT
jgi:signal transduction histidine kinase